MTTYVPLNTTDREILTLEEIFNRYKDEWVLIVEPELDEDLNVICGEVIAHSPDRDELYSKLGLREGRSSAIEYTGSMLDGVVFEPFSDHIFVED